MKKPWVPARARAPIAAILFVAGMSASLAPDSFPAFADSLAVGGATVTAHPREPGSPVRLTVSFTIRETLEIDDTITLEVDDTLGVPRTIKPDAVLTTGLATVTRTGPDGNGTQARLISQPSVALAGMNLHGAFENHYTQSRPRTHGDIPYVGDPSAYRLSQTPHPRG